MLISNTAAAPRLVQQARGPARDDVEVAVQRPPAAQTPRSSWRSGVRFPTHQKRRGNADALQIFMVDTCGWSGARGGRTVAGSRHPARDLMARRAQSQPVRSRDEDQ